MGTWNVEQTDTFGGEANYCWVRRETIEAKSDRDLVRKAKAFAGYTGRRCRVDNLGNMVQITPIGKHRELTTVFCTWSER
jgi:hypothetical protein